MASSVPAHGAPADLALRHPRRVSATVTHQTYTRLLARSDIEGRSLSSLIAFILETQTPSLERSQQASTTVAAPARDFSSEV